MFAVRRAIPAVRAAGARSFSDAAAAAGMTLNFSLPHRSVYFEKSVDRVVIPGMEGVYGITAGHTPIVSEMKPGVVDIVHAAGEEPEKYFVSGGIAITHDNSLTEISAIEAVQLDEIDGDAVKDSFAKAKTAFDGAEAGSMEKAEAQIQMEVSKEMAAAIGVAV
eukprot:CAMPEP_0118961566 /NCGR_PEP_ID=MMETSP1173-20130426/206_1 /TAXON_ID=1034831 /ORGANISM="Rhizochromulina marina cf, Strain CCMP1243" /LENGTH=163 /DNA_ID=CAMNT_0006909745 /DNA_START=44 /DNA_END=535 /DNA_ORIENTATION=-